MLAFNDCIKTFFFHWSVVEFLGSTMDDAIAFGSNNAVKRARAGRLVVAGMLESWQGLSAGSATMALFARVESKLRGGQKKPSSATDAYALDYFALF